MQFFYKLNTNNIKGLSSHKLILYFTRCAFFRSLRTRKLYNLRAVDINENIIVALISLKLMATKRFRDASREVTNFYSSAERRVSSQGRSFPCVLRISISHRKTDIFVRQLVTLTDSLKRCTSAVYIF